MNRIKMFMNRFVFNSKLNREKFEINKKKTTKKHHKNYKMIRVNHYHTFPPQNDGNEPPDWRLFVVAALAFYSINKFKR